METNTTPNTATKQLAEGQPLARTTTDHGPRVQSTDLVFNLTGSNELADQGWRVAEFDGTGFRVFVRLTGEKRWVAAWDAWAALVEVADIETVGKNVEGFGFGCWAELGEVRGGRKWLARLDGLTA